MHCVLRVGMGIPVHAPPSTDDEYSSVNNRFSAPANHQLVTPYIEERLVRGPDPS